MNSNFYVAVEGPIGVGKTTLARILHEEMGGELLLEVFEENPFLSDFYADRARYAFQTQIFFLLSRYRQQRDVAPQTLQQHSLISDYLFAKDRLFAHLNLTGDELDVYERTHAALGEQIVTPDLVVHLRASTDVLMNRIARRDRTYERSMSRQYIDDLRIAYERFFADYDQAPVLNVDTAGLDFVSQGDDRRYIVGLVRSALHLGPYQQALPDIPPALTEAVAAGAPSGRGQGRLAMFQRLDRATAREDGQIPELYLDYLGLTEKIGALGREVKRLWVLQAPWRSQVEATSTEAAVWGEARNGLRGGLVDALSYLLKLANDAGIDLEDAYLKALEAPHA